MISGKEYWKMKRTPRVRGAKKTRLNGFTFDSRSEARRYQELRLLEKAEKINSLEVHRRFPLEYNGTHICNYEADFCYWTRDVSGRLHYVVEDVKGHRTDVFKLKKKLMKALLGVDVIETRPR